MNRGILAALIGAVALSGCATPGGERSNEKATTGAIIGGIIGGVVANNTGKQSGGKTAIGVIAGAAIGGAIGNEMDRNEEQLRRIAAERDAREMDVERVRDDLLRVSVASEASFDFDRHDLKPEFKPTLNKVADVLNGSPNLRIQVVGHTDSQGGEVYNQRLSERRAQATADYLIARGVGAARIRAEGHGESTPRADNGTAAGRAQNRRVEIFVQQLPPQG